ncbi:MAG: flagellar biosynthesis anti-sigma factor FlgM [Myxococcota bacterium]|nr:flagellar biosynthesis anti-sigma factor FlgM [Myxococcota bacterium]
MKIHGINQVAPVEAVRGPKGSTKTGGSGRASDQVQLSASAQWLKELHEAARAMPEVRPEEVARARGDILNGELGSEADIESAVDALLAEI